MYHNGYQVHIQEEPPRICHPSVWRACARCPRLGLCSRLLLCWPRQRELNLHILPVRSYHAGNRRCHQLVVYGLGQECAAAAAAGKLCARGDTGGRAHHVPGAIATLSMASSAAARLSVAPPARRFEAAPGHAEP